MSSELPQTYTPKDFSFVYDYRNQIKQAGSAFSSLYGQNEYFYSSAIAASIAEEYHDRYETRSDTFTQGLADFAMAHTSHQTLLDSFDRAVSRLGENKSEVLVGWRQA
jgi:uncharacterized protein with gpF-like domain